MKPVIIDKESCTGCGLCAAVCPYRALTITDGVAQYQLESCFVCGHCSAVCPEKAAKVPGLVPIADILKSGNADVLAKVESSSSRMLLEIMARRRSCRNFKNDKIDLPLLEYLVTIGTTAPSGTNCQPWNFVIFPERSDLLGFGEIIGRYYKRLNRLAEKKYLRLLTRFFGAGALSRYYENHYHSVQEAIDAWDVKGEDRLFHGAVAAILVTVKKDASCSQEDGLLATQNILLAADSMGLGACLIGFAVEAAKRDRKIGRAVAIPDDEILVAVIALGYPEIIYPRPAMRKKIDTRVFRFDKVEES